MRSCLAAVLLAAWIIVGLSVAPAHSVSVGAIVGAHAACDPALQTCSYKMPLAYTSLCVAGCPFRVSPSFTSPTRFWAALGNGVGSCVVSDDGGLTWPACTTQPFLTGANELYAEAADGSILAVGTTTGPNTCTVRRSTDLAASWTTVFTQLSNCNSGNLEGQRIICLPNGTCNFVASAGGVGQAFDSSDNGQNWVAGIAGIAPNCSMTGIAWDGSFGVAPSSTSGCGGGGVARAHAAVGSVWADTAPWTGLQGNCWGQVMFDGNATTVCQSSGATPDSRYTLRNEAGTLVKSLNLPDALLTSIDAGGPAWSPRNGVLYVLATRTGTLGTALYASRDDANTFGVVTSLLGNMRGGHFLEQAGCIYFVHAGPTRFGKVCP